MRAQVDPSLVVSMHTFNPVYEGSVRDFDIGVLTTFESPVSSIVAHTLSAHGFKVTSVRKSCRMWWMQVRMNAPWSGKDGFMYR